MIHDGMLPPKAVILAYPIKWATGELRHLMEERPWIDHFLWWIEIFGRINRNEATTYTVSSLMCVLLSLDILIIPVAHPKISSLMFRVSRSQCHPVANNPYSTAEKITPVVAPRASMFSGKVMKICRLILRCPRHISLPTLNLSDKLSISHTIFIPCICGNIQKWAEDWSIFPDQSTIGYWSVVFQITNTLRL